VPVVWWRSRQLLGQRQGREISSFDHLQSLAIGTGFESVVGFVHILVFVSLSLVLFAPVVPAIFEIGNYLRTSHLQKERPVSARLNKLHVQKLGPEKGTHAIRAASWRSAKSNREEAVGKTGGVQV
jgi:hypothetical protein